jgi:hypothetical protein
MTDNDSRDPQATQANNTPSQNIQAQGTQAQDVQAPDIPTVPVRLIRGTASPEELSALIAVVAVMSSSGSEDEAGSEAHKAAHGLPPRLQWSSPARMVRKAPRPGPGGWRASAFPS